MARERRRHHRHSHTMLWILEEVAFTMRFVDVDTRFTAVLARMSCTPHQHCLRCCAWQRDGEGHGEVGGSEMDQTRRTDRGHVCCHLPTGECRSRWLWQSQIPHGDSTVPVTVRQAMQDKRAWQSKEQEHKVRTQGWRACNTYLRKGGLGVDDKGRRLRADVVGNQVAVVTAHRHQWALERRARNRAVAVSKRKKGVSEVAVEKSRGTHT